MDQLSRTVFVRVLRPEGPPGGKWGVANEPGALSLDRDTLWDTKQNFTFSP